MRTCSAVIHEKQLNISSPIANANVDSALLYKQAVKLVDREIGDFAIGVENNTLTRGPRCTSTIIFHTKVDGTDCCTMRIVCAVDRVEQVKQLTLPRFRWEIAGKNG